jgi:putative SOS response-associated peptidase YedK
MCGRYTSTSSPARLAEAFQVNEVTAEQLPIRFNVAPTQPVYAVAESRRAAWVRGPDRDAENGRRLLGTFRWGLVPSWAKDPRIGAKMINARSEGLAGRTAYKKAFARRRCIVPADAFYEWQVVDGVADGRIRGRGRGHKQPYAFRRRDGEPLAFAGLWELWRSPTQPESEPLRTCVIITTRANAVVEPIHGRMPAILPAGAWDAWLDPGNDDLETLQALLVPAPGEDLEAWAVSARVNKSENEGPDLIEPCPSMLG